MISNMVFHRLSSDGSVRLSTLWYVAASVSSCTGNYLAGIVTISEGVVLLMGLNIASIAVSGGLAIVVYLQISK